MIERMPTRGGSRLARFAIRAADALSSALSRFPFPVLAIGLLAAVANLEIADIRLFDARYDARVVTTLLVGAALSIAATLVFERAGAGTSRRIFGAAVIGIAGMVLTWFGWDGLLFVPPFLAAAILAIPLAPYVGRSTSLRFWTFTLWTCFGVALGFASVLLFVLGVSAILEMVRYLFGIGLSGDAYQHIYATACLFVGPLFALGRIPRDFDEEAALDRSDRFATGIAVLQNWVALPLVLAAAAILHLYVAKILVTGEVPKNQIGWIVGVYAMLVLSLRVAAGPFIAVGGGAQRFFGRAWVPILVVPIALLSYALWLRIGAEGFTAERYYLALAAVAAALILFAQALPAVRGDIRVMVAVPVALLAASSFGPWGAAATVGRSQTARIAATFASGDDGRLHPETLNEAQRDVLRSRLGALAEVDALPRLDPLLTDAVRSKLESAATSASDREAYVQALGLEYGAAATGYASFSSNAPEPFDVSGFDLVQAGFQAGENDRSIEQFSQDSLAILHAGRLELRFRGIADRIDLAPVVERLWPAGASDPAVAGRPLTVDVSTLGGRTLRLHVTALGRSPSDGAPVAMSFDIAARAAEWRPPPPSLGGDGNR